MAGLFARENKLDDAIIVNTQGRICESAIANIFIIKDDVIYTPPLSEGCVAGVMRRWLLEKSSLKDHIIEQKLETEDLFQADEFFLTNSINLLRWVEKFRHKKYNNKKTTHIFEQVKKEIEAVVL
jgi:branched-chain amino acid aminotransferase